MPPAQDPFLTIGVMSTPSHNTIFREQWRMWAKLFNDTDARVREWGTRGGTRAGVREPLPKLAARQGKVGV